MKPYYEDESVTLYHGDCREVLPDLPPADLVLTDPPYGINYVSNAGVGKGTRPITNDGARLSLRLYRSVFPLLRADHILWFTRWDAWPDVWVEMGQWFPMRGMLIWDKGTPGMGDLNHWGLSYEMIASAGVGRISGGRDGSILRFNGVPPASRVHPTEKPTQLLTYLIDKLGAKTIVDPFAGSGSTLLAAKNLGLSATGIEFDERYCEAIAKRLDQGVLDFGGVA